MSSSILVAGLFHETHTFVDEVTSTADFQVRRADEMLACSGDASPLGGVLEFAQEEGWRMIPTIDYRAIPSGIVDDEVVAAWWNDFEAAWQPECDAIFLVLHGAMVSQNIRDVEGDILMRVRRLAGLAVHRAVLASLASRR